MDAKVDNQKIFLILNGIPIKLRYIIVLVFLALGISFQILADNFILAWIFILAAVLLLWMRNYSTKPKDVGLGATQWQMVSEDMYKKAKGKLDEVSKRPKPINVAFIIPVILIVMYVLSSELETVSVVYFLVFALLLVLIPILGTGKITYWAPDGLQYSMDQMSDLLVEFNDKVVIEYYLEMDPSYHIPLNSRLSLKLKDAPEGFIGIQVQTSANDVNGRLFPYTYCVLLAKKEFGLEEKLEQIKKTDKYSEIFGSRNKYVVDITDNEDVSVVVVRKKTGKTEYSTSKPEVSNTVGKAILLSENIIAL